MQDQGRDHKEQQQGLAAWAQGTRPILPDWKRNGSMQAVQEIHKGQGRSQSTWSEQRPRPSPGRVDMT